MDLFLNLVLILIVSLGVFVYVTRASRREHPWGSRAHGTVSVLTALGALTLYLILGAPEVPTAYRHGHREQAQENGLKVQRIFLEHKTQGPLTAGNVGLHMMLLDVYQRLGLGDKAQALEKRLKEYLSQP